MKRRSLAFLVVLVAGCAHGPSAVPVPDYSAAATAEAAFREYDKNGDGVLDQKELEQCPALKAFVQKQLKSTRLEMKDLADRLRSYQEGGTGLLGTSVVVLRNGQPFAGATVTFDPESFHGGAIKPAGGVTQQSGMAILKQDGATISGAAPGFYRVRVSLKDAQGQETVPDRCNSRTILGEELSPTMKTRLIVRLDF